MSRRLDNQTHEYDSPDTDGGKIAELLGTLPRVEAPSNFDFGVKAKIAAANESTSRASLIPFAKVAAPLALILVAVGFVVFYGSLPSDADRAAENPPSSVEKVDQPPVVNEGAPIDPPEASGPQVTEAVAQTLERAPRSRTSPGVRNANSNNRSQGGSTDIPMSVDRTVVAPDVILPPGFQSVNPGNRNTVGGVKDIPLKDVLGILGINAEFVDGAWKVRSTNANSTADRAGVRANDLLEAIDSKPLSEKTTYKGAFEPRVLRVRRDGKSIDINLRNSTVR